MSSVRTTIVFALLTSAVLLAACSPWHFKMQEKTGWEIEGKIYDYHKGVNVAANNQVFVTSPAAIAIRTEQITDGTFDVEMTFAGGSQFASDHEVTLIMRSTPYDDTVSNAQAIAIVITQEATTVVDGDRSTTIAAQLPPPGTPFRVRVVSHGHDYDVEVACTNIGRFTTPLPSTQWVSIHPSGKRTLELRDPKFRPLAEEF